MLLKDAILKLSPDAIKLYTSSKANQFMDVEVLAVNSVNTLNKWPGKHKKVIDWFHLSNGMAVGFNEHKVPKQSFVVIKMNKRKYNKKGK